MFDKQDNVHIKGPAFMLSRVLKAWIDSHPLPHTNNTAILTQESEMQATQSTPSTCGDSTEQASLSDMLRAHGLVFPLLIKPIVAHGCKEAHNMTIVFNESALRQPGVLDDDCIVQQYIHHTGVLYKVCAK